MLDVNEMNKRHGWLHAEEALALYDMARSIKARRILEVGSWQGRSTYVLCEALKQILAVDASSLRKAGDLSAYMGHVYSVDHLQGVPGSSHNIPNGGVYGELSRKRNEIVEAFLNNTRYHREVGCHTWLEISVESFYRSHIANALFNNNPLDLAFLDDDHSYDAVKFGITRAYYFLREGGILCGHDYRTHGNEGVKQAVDELVFAPNGHFKDWGVCANTSIWWGIINDYRTNPIKVQPTSRA